MPIHFRLRYCMGHAIVGAPYHLDLMLTCTYRGISYQVPARYRVEHELKYNHQTYTDRMNNANKIMMYRGISHALAAN